MLGLWTFLLVKIISSVKGNSSNFYSGSEFLSYKIELGNRVMQNDVTLRVTNSEIFIEIFFWVTNSTS